MSDPAGWYRTCCLGLISLATLVAGCASQSLESPAEAEGPEGIVIEAPVVALYEAQQLADRRNFVAADRLLDGILTHPLKRKDVKAAIDRVGRIESFDYLYEL